ncbi:MAG: UDP-N-acetylglucosamine--N-acetylmuramyl-(pentapeptide) pyrophosphoryl-undecaprenol N-acetylglucosamine transferase, partial [Clostridiales bacterium]|nr:UDP-N-acetylglucosamine--N-acetylmuramyl-(pentapeptide) pyrophosphoryl-undecaprenol N-acetylglucosamine transferase [Clostridiales bacterium]
MKVLMTCGGTGGHINPAIAVANRIKTISPGAEIAFVGTEKGMEASLVPKAGYSIRFVKVRGFKRKLTLANIDAAVKAVTSVVAAKKIIRDFSPDVVIGTGGYVSWPTVKAAAKLGVPTLIQEQNAFPGVTQRMLAKYADKICVSFEESRKFFDDAVQDKILLTGNPVAASAFTRAQAREKLGLAPDALYVVSSGGSLGAEKVNEYVFEVIGAYTGPKGIRHIHSVGRAGWEKYSRLAGERGFDRYGNIRIAEYIYDMQLH